MHSAELNPSIRKDLVFRPRGAGDDRHWVVEDPVSGRFCRVGRREYLLISLLDGSRTCEEAFQSAKRCHGGHDLTAENAAKTMEWLRASGLLAGEQSPKSESQNSARQNPQASSIMQLGRILSFRVSFASPDSTAKALSKRLGWLFAPALIPLFAAVLLWGVSGLVNRWAEFCDTSRLVLSTDNWALLLAMWIGLKVIHESAHAIVNRRYGGRVRDAGLLFIMLAPLAYVDVTSSWRFRSRWKRIHVALAGIQAELMVCAVAMLIWLSTSDAWLSQLCVNVIVMSSVTTLMFNANPLMRFDGYYALTDFVGVPNLSVVSRRMSKARWRRILYGLHASVPAVRSDRIQLVRLYGILSSIWRILVVVGLIVGASYLWDGAGIALSALAFIVWIAKPACESVWRFLKDESLRAAQRIRCVGIIAVSACLLALILTRASWPFDEAVPMVAVSGQETVMRAAGDGFVAELLVECGEEVVAGQSLMRLTNDELASEIRQLEIQIEQSLVRDRILRHQMELAGCQAEAANRESLETELTQKRL